MAWKKVEEAQIVWVCKEDDCQGKGSITGTNPEWLLQDGTPVCNQCDRDMNYSHTEIKE
jgi:hypothetical protein